MAAPATIVSISKGKCFYGISITHDHSYRFYVVLIFYYNSYLLKKSEDHPLLHSCHGRVSIIPVSSASGMLVVLIPFLFPPRCITGIAHVVVIVTAVDVQHHFSGGQVAVTILQSL